MFNLVLQAVNYNIVLAILLLSLTILVYINFLTFASWSEYLRTYLQDKYISAESVSKKIRPVLLTFWGRFRLISLPYLLKTQFILQHERLTVFWGVGRDSLLDNLVNFILIS